MRLLLHSPLCAHLYKILYDAPLPPPISILTFFLFGFVPIPQPPTISTPSHSLTHSLAHSLTRSLAHFPLTKPETMSSFRHPAPSAPQLPPGARTQPPQVGLQLHATNLHPQFPEDRYDANIMHRVVPPTLQQVTVQKDASTYDLAATFSLPVGYVAAHWLTSRTPMDLPGFENAVVHPIAPASRVTLRRQPLSPAQLSSYRHLAVALTRKLDAHVQSSKPHANLTTSRPSRARIEKLHAQALATIVDANATSSNTSTVSSSSAPDAPVDLHPVRIPPSRRTLKDRCGFSAASSHAHQDLILSLDRKNLSKKHRGLYRCARTTAPLNAAWNHYVEFVVKNTAGQGGMCVGLSSADSPLNRLVGTTASSVGFHSSGKVVMRKGEWLPYGTSFGQGDTVGMLVEMPPERASDISSAESLSAPSGADNDHQTNHRTNTTGTRTPIASLPRITFFVNGVSQGTLPLQDDTFSIDDKDCALLLYPTACLYHADSSIEIKCCAKEWEYFPSALAVCSGLRATCHRRNSKTERGSSISSGADGKSKFSKSRVLGGCASVLTP